MKLNWNVKFVWILEWNGCVVIFFSDFPLYITVYKTANKKKKQKNKIHPGKEVKYKRFSSYELLEQCFIARTQWLYKIINNFKLRPVSSVAICGKIKHTQILFKCWHLAVTHSMLRGKTYIAGFWFSGIHNTRWPNIALLLLDVFFMFYPYH